MQLNRRGFTLAELLVAMVLLGIVSAALYRVLVNNQRVYTAQTQRIAMQQNIRAAGNILPAEFRELDAAENDIKAMSATSLTIRAQRWLGIACIPPVMGGALGGLTATVMGGTPGTPLFYGSRAPIANSDSVLVYYDGNATTRTDDAWMRGNLTANVVGACPGGGAGRVLTFTLANTQPNFAGAIPAGAPIRGYEVVTYSLYRPAGDTSWYVGYAPQGQAPQPLIGPIMPNGLQFTYFDSLGVATATPARVARIDIVVMARTEQQVRAGGSNQQRTLVDTVFTSVALRNNKRF